MGEKIIFAPLEILILTRIQAGKGNGSPPGESEVWQVCILKTESINMLSTFLLLSAETDEPTGHDR